MSDWFSKAQKFVDNFTESIVEQANVAQAQMAVEQSKVRDEVAKSKQQFEGEGTLPWETDDDSLAILTQDVMEKILSLSLTEQNFTIPPPSVEIMPFQFSNYIPTAMRLLSLDANLARMHAKLSPKMDEEVFWRHYFFRIKYIRLLLGIEKPESSTYATMKGLNEDDVVYKPTFEPPPKVATQRAKKAASPVSSPASKTPEAESPKSANNSNSNKEQASGNITGQKNVPEELDPEELERKNVLQQAEARRIAEAALAAEVEAELDDDDIDLTDLGDLELGDDVDDFDDLGDLDDVTDDDAELEAQIAKELAEERK